MVLEIRSFLKLAYGVNSEYYLNVDQIKFTHESPDRLSTFYEQANATWKKGRTQLWSLLSHVVAEEKERIKLEGLASDNPYLAKYARIGAVFVICMLAIWASPSDLLCGNLNKTTLWAIKIAVSTVFAFMLVTFLVREEQWKIFLLTAAITILVPILQIFMTNAPSSAPFPSENTTPSEETTLSQKAKDTITVSKKPAPDTSKPTKKKIPSGRL